MASDLILSVEFFAAVITLVYVLKLIFLGRHELFISQGWSSSFEKRSLMNQDVRARVVSAT